MHARLLLVITLALAACSSTDGGFDPALEGLALHQAQPELLVRGSTLILKGRSFVGAPYGEPYVVFEGQVDNGDSRYQVEITRRATFIDLETLSVEIDQQFLDLLGSETADFSGSIRVDIDSLVDGKLHSSSRLSSRLSFASELTPTITSMPASGPLFVNDRLRVIGSGFLLGGGEGSTIATIEGCFASSAEAPCFAQEPVEVALQPAQEFSRDLADLVFSPSIAGIEPGHFRGTISFANRHAGGNEVSSSQLEVDYDLSEAALFAAGPSTVSLGRYLEVSGGGFVANENGGSTLLQLRGSYEPLEGRTIDVDMLLVPEFLQGRKLRYPINEDDTLGQSLDLRYSRGTFRGTLQVLTSFRGVSVEGNTLPFEVELEPVKQVVFLNFTPQYLDALRAFGMRAMDSAIRERIVAILERDYATINLEVRLEEPSDYSLYSTVEIGGVDPNGLGLLGYDNTPGKDNGNLRLHDYIGGVNATTQLDNFPGFGGVFIESLFVFSEHPGDFAPKAGVGHPMFDDIFDRFRPDRGGKPVRAADLQGGVPSLSGAGCPSKDRAQAISCAAWTLANLVGTTLSHEIGHSLGLANPSGSAAHHITDAPNRLMDAGSFRPFLERAELEGQGPATFCAEAYLYLRTILPTDAPNEVEGRPTCF